MRWHCNDDLVKFIYITLYKIKVVSKQHMMCWNTSHAPEQC